MTSLLDKIVTYGPKRKVLTKDQAERSVVVQNIPPDTAADSIVIHFQRQKNGGGEIDHVHIPEKGTAVITFESSEVAENVLEHFQKLGGSELKLDRFIPKEPPEVFQKVEARMSFDKCHISPHEHQKLIEILKGNTEVVVRTGSKDFILSGKFSQIEYANKLLQYLKGGNEAIHHGGNVDQTHQDSSRGSDELGSEPSSVAKSSSFEVQPQFMKLLKQVYKRDLQDIEEKFVVKIVWEENASEVCISSRKKSKSQNRFPEGCEAFIDLYQKFHPKIRREVVELSNEASESRIREAISSVQRDNPAIVEKVENSLVVYAENDVISSTVYALEQTLGLREDSSRRKTRRGQRNESRDAHEHYEAQQPFSPLPQHLNQVLKNGVVLSLYQGDITDERVDAIVNAANENLQHGAGVAAAIVRKGGRQIQEESNRLTKKYGQLDVGKAAYTSGGFLPCRYVIHAVGPRWGSHGGERSILLLRQACVQSLRLAVRLELSSIALTAISSGIFGMPKDICAQVMFKAVEEFSASDDAEFSTLRDVRMVIIDDPTISVFQEEFVKRYLSKEAPRTMTNQRRPCHEEIETSPATILKQDPQKFSGDTSVDSVGRTHTEDNKPSDAKSKQNGEFESPSEQTAQDKENNDQRDVSESIKERPLSNQGTENTKKANVPSSVRSPETEQEGVDSETKGDNSASVENSHKDNKRMPSKPPSGRGRGNLAPTFPGKDRSTSNGSIHLQGQHGGAVRGRGVTSKTVTTTSSPPGLTVTEEGKNFARHLRNHENEKQANGVVSVECKKETEVVESKTTSLQKSRQSQESESQKQKQSQIKVTDESEESNPTEQKTLPGPNLNQENTSGNPLPPREKITDLDKSPEGSPRRDQCKNQHSNIYEDVTEVPHPDADAKNDGRMMSHDPLVSQTTSRQMEAVIKASAKGEPITRGPHPTLDLQASLQGVNKVDGDVEGDSKDAQSGRSREVTGPLTLKDTYNNGHMREPTCMMCINSNKDPVCASKCGRGHFYCESCIKCLLEKARICPQCEKEGPPKGNQPIGYMSWTTETQRSLSGYQDCGIIVVCFRFDKGTQGAEHPNPGKPYSGLVFNAFLPCNTEGQELCTLLKMAFEARLLFTIGTSPATGEKDVIVCNGIELKTSQSGGPANYGYPDPSYLDRMKSQLAEKGITHPSLVSDV